ncbi:MAG: NUDIX domain-containing protein [Nanoarchaeota archaeon]|nr:NUDIX domain-containing protein [Nanoarchaeota archaeon]
MIQKMSVAILIERDDKILLIKRGVPPEKGSWALPGGHVDEGESPRDAAIREAKEEIGETEIEPEPFDINPVEENRVGKRLKCHYFRGTLKEEPHAKDDAAAVGWFTLEQIKTMDIAYYTRFIINRTFEDQL